jgi:hypothetical protein
MQDTTGWPADGRAADLPWTRLHYLAILSIDVAGPAGDPRNTRPVSPYGPSAQQVNHCQEANHLPNFPGKNEKNSRPPREFNQERADFGDTDGTVLTRTVITDLS